MPSAARICLRLLGAAIWLAWVVPGQGQGPLAPYHTLAGESAVYLAEGGVYVGQSPPGGGIPLATAGDFPVAAVRLNPLPPLDPFFPGEAILPGEALPPGATEVYDRLSDYKDGFFQKFALTGTWLYRNGSDTYEVTELETYLTVALPAPTVEWPLLITPGYTLRSLEGPVQLDLPARVHDAYVQGLWAPRFSERISLVLSGTWGVHSDFSGLTSHAYRTTGWGVVRYQYQPGVMEWVFGAAYLGRDDYTWVPLVGAILDPSSEWHLELVAPRPKVARRIFTTDFREYWVYLAAEFGGDTWSVSTPRGTERLTLSDWRAVAGLECKRGGGAGWRAEAGYVFDRSIELSGAGEATLRDTFLLRAGLTF